MADGGTRGVQEAQRTRQRLFEKQILDNLLRDYCEFLKSLGRKSHREAQTIFDLHVRKPWSNLIGRPASSISVEDSADIMRRVVRQGKGKTANKLRSHLRAA